MSQRQGGVALITAMLVLALASIAAAAVLVSAQSNIRRTGNLLDSERAWWYAEGLESWVRAVLKRDDKPEYDGLNEPWAQRVDYLPVEQGALRGSITDLQGRFNLNNLAPNNKLDATAKEQFVRLFAAIEKLQGIDAAPIAEAIADWIDEDQIPTGAGGAEDSEYSNAKPPYRAGNQPMRSISELRAVRGVTPEIFEALREHIAALPLPGGAGSRTPTLINANTATLPVLLSLTVSMAAKTAQVSSWAEARESQPVDDAGLKQMSDTFPPDAQKLLGVTSQYFLMEGQAFIGSGRVALYSVLMRPSAGAAPVVITRSLDTE